MLIHELQLRVALAELQLHPATSGVSPVLPGPDNLTLLFTGFNSYIRFDQALLSIVASCGPCQRTVAPASRHSCLTFRQATLALCAAHHGA